jgi:hypothetical protein
MNNRRKKTELPENNNTFKGFIPLLIAMALITSLDGIGQVSIKSYAEISENNVSGGIFLRSALIPKLRLGNNSFEGGIEENLYYPGKPHISGVILNAAREYRMKRSVLCAQLFWITDFNSDILHENIWGGKLKIGWNHFALTLGTTFNSLVFSNKAVKQYNLGVDASSMHETYNILYDIRYNLKKAHEKYNISLALTDADYFTSNQVTNPIFCIGGSVKIAGHLELIADANYRCAGFTNFAFGYFGSTFKTGAIWNF